MTEKSPYGPKLPGEPSGRDLIAAMTAQYEAATAKASAYQAHMDQASTTAEDDQLRVTVALGGEVTDLDFITDLATTTPARLTNSFSRLYHRAAGQGTRSMADAFGEYPEIAEHLQRAAPPEDPADSSIAVRSGASTKPDDATGDAPLPLPADAALDRWFALFNAHDNPIDGLNAITRDPEFQSARPGGDPHQWTSDLRSELTTMIERGRSLLPELQAIVAEAESPLAVAVVTPAGAVQELRFRPAINSADPELAAQQVLEVLAAARLAASQAADELLQAPSDSFYSDFRPWKEA